MQVEAQAQAAQEEVLLTVEDRPGPSDLDVAREKASSTPMMRQYLEVKAQFPDCILFFRLGDFYEMFFEDALLASDILQITLTARSKGADKVPMCGVPHHAARRYIGRLIEAGHKVAICDQVEEPGGKGIVRREVVRVVTPGTTLDEDLLPATQNHFLASLVWNDKGAAAAMLDASTGDFFVVEGTSLGALTVTLARTEPKELVVAEGLATTDELGALKAMLGRTPPVATLESAAFDATRAAAFLKKHFGVASLDGFGLGGRPLAVAAAGAALRYVKETQRTRADQVDRIQVLEAGGFLVLDESSRANLEVQRTLKDGARKGSLLGVMDKTVTAAGGRLLSRWLNAPLRSVALIEARLEAVEELSKKGVWREELAGRLRPVADIERILGRLSAGVGNARDLLALSQSLAALPSLAQSLGQCSASLLQGLVGALDGFGDLTDTLQRAILDEPAALVREGGMIRPGFHAELDEIVALSTSGKEFLLKLELRERERTQIGSLKVRYNRVFGYYLEVTRSNLHLVPKDYIRKQTTVGAERYVTPELKEYEEKVLTAEERRCALELQLFEELRARVLTQAGALRGAAQALAAADALRSFAQCAAEYGYVRPSVDESDVLEITSGRHPVVERSLKGEPFVPNDVRLDRKSAQLLILTGPNMAGKSTIMRQTALIVLLAQAGSFVPAKSARIGVCDRIFTRVGAADNLAQGQSTFMVEMTETASILHNATGKSLILLDEIGRGTSTFDGLSIAWAVAEQIHDKVGARTLFATHYHELVELAQKKDRVKNASVSVKETDGRVVFLRKLVPEGASRSYGIEVARIAGLPREVVQRARGLLKKLEAGEWDEGRVKDPAYASKDQLALFAGERAPVLETHHALVLEELKGLAVDSLTPLQALNLLAKWKAEL